MANDGAALAADPECWAGRGEGLRELIERLRREPAVSVSEEASAWCLHVARPPGYETEVVVPSSVFEWFVTIRQGSSEVWSDWMDYEGYDSQATADDHAAAMRVDIEAFLGALLSSEELRLRTVRELLVFKHKKVEWRVNGEWSEVSLATGRSPASG